MIHIVIYIISLILLAESGRGGNLTGDQVTET